MDVRAGLPLLLTTKNVMGANHPWGESFWMQTHLGWSKSSMGLIIQRLGEYPWAKFTVSK